ncbi:MAG TPA: tetratricopeptide repeat protein [Ignavibacteria bacterium]|nr:tetratricopeptide repeat protein [Ignavibacteria bacterium]HMR40715.1 tetratricopeptide repeat protein [Ignavibacteria bacterium]
MRTKIFLRSVFFIFSLVLYGKPSVSQQTADTLNLVKDLRTQNKYEDASSLLKKYLKNNPSDVNALWLFAQTNFWLGNLKVSDNYYKKALSLDPGNDYLNIDYARTLANTGEWKEAASILDKLKEDGKDYSDADFIMAKILYWKNDFNGSEKLLKNVLWKDGNNTGAYNLLQEVMTAKAPWLKVKASALHDNQPLDNQILSIEYGKFYSPLASIYIGSYFPFYAINGKSANAFWIRTGVKSFFSDIDLHTQADAGVFEYPDNSKADWTANIYLKKVFGKYFTADLMADHTPYLNTLISVDTTLSNYNFSASLGWDDISSVSGKAGYLYSLFPKSKYVYAAYGWIYSPPVKFSGFEIKPGYSFNYSNSSNNTFRALNSVDEIISNYYYDRYIDGIYDPYFTPKDQLINSGLLSINYTPSEGLQFGLNLNIGIYSTVKNPYLYLNSDSTGQIYIDKSYSKEKFYPATVNFFTGYQISEKMLLRLQYDYQKTNFYINNYFGISYILSFWNGKE